MSVGFSGIGSGNDFSGLIEKLMEIERAPIQALERRKYNTNRQLSVVSDLVSKLAALDSKAQELDQVSELRAFSARSSDETKLKITASGNAALGVHRIAVATLASGQTNRSRSFASNTDGIAGAGTLTVQVGADAAVQIDYTTSDDLSDIAQKINDAAVRVNASALFDGTSWRLLVSSEETGLANGITFTDPGDQLGMNQSGNLIATAQDSEITLDGLTITRPKNELSDVLPGLTLSLVGTTTSGVTVDATVTQDSEGLRKKVQGLLDKFNDLAKLVNGQLGNQLPDATKSSMFGDSSVRALQRRLGGISSSSYPAGPSTASLAAFGIKLGSDGTLSLDATKFDAAVAKNRVGFEDLWSGPSGVVAALKAAVKEYTQSGSGLFSSKQTGLQERIKLFDKQITRIGDAATRTEERLRRTYAALDRTLTELQSQTVFLNQLFK